MAGNKITKIKFSPIDIEERKKLDFKAGDTISVSSKILDEKGKFRLQAFEGIVLARKHGKEVGATFTVRKVASGVGVERIFPLYSPMIGKIEITKRSHARRSKLYYIRTKAIKDVRSKMRSVTNQEAEEMETSEKVEE
jgi:large subunit ribosomal protein L19